MRKNRARFNPERPDSILEHGLSDEKLDELYRRDDWHEFSAGDASYLEVKEHQIPYAIFPNSDDVTSEGGEPMFSRLESVIEPLWERWRSTH